MNCSCLPQLEKLLSGKSSSVKIKRTNENTRENVMSDLNNMIIQTLGGVPKGEFVNKDNAEYIVYELHFTESNASFSSIRLLDFGDMFKLIRV